MRAPTLLPVVLVLAAAGAGAVTEQECDDDRDVLYEDLAANRERSLALIGAAMQASEDEAERAYLREEHAQVWHEEERQRAFGDHIWRDCLRHVRERGKTR